MKLALIGTGKIIKDALYAMTPLLSEAEPRITLTSIFAHPRGDSAAAHEEALEKGRLLAKAFRIPAVYTDYEKLLSETDADTVYIGLVNKAHYEYAKKALFSGKNVILEKPFTGRFQEAEELFRIADERKLLIFEAATVLHSPMIPKMKEALSGIGPVKAVYANYAQYSSAYAKYCSGNVTPAFDPAAFGGALYDIGVYNLYYILSLFGTPKSTVYFANPGWNGVDTGGTLALGYDGFSAFSAASKDSDGPCMISIQGESGNLILHGKPNFPEKLSVTRVLAEPGISADSPRRDAEARAGSSDSPRRDSETPTHSLDSPRRDASGAIIRPSETEEYFPPKVFHRMTQEFSDFADAVDSSDFDAYRKWKEITLNVMRVLESEKM